MPAAAGSGIQLPAMDLHLQEHLHRRQKPGIRYPPAYKNKRVMDFIDHFFEMDDDVNKEEEFLNCFADSGFYVIGLKTVAGREGKFLPFCPRRLASDYNMREQKLDG